MPIRPEQRSLYPYAWKAISFSIRFDRAQGRCECEGECDLHAGRRCTEVHGKPASYAKGKIVLTVAHLNHDPTDCNTTNLKAMCQRCHLRYDRAHHAETRARRRA